MVFGGDNYHLADKLFFYFCPSHPMTGTREGTATVTACSAEEVQFPAVPRVVIPIIDSDEETSDSEYGWPEESEEEVPAMAVPVTDKTLSSYTLIRDVSETFEPQVDFQHAVMDPERENEEPQPLAQPKTNLSARFSVRHQQGAHVSSKKASMKTNRRPPAWMKLCKEIGDKDNHPFPSTLYRRRELTASSESDKFGEKETVVAPLRKRKHASAADVDEFSDRVTAPLVLSKSKFTSITVPEKSNDQEAVTAPLEKKKFLPAEYLKDLSDGAVTTHPRKSLPQKRKLASLTNCDESEGDTVTSLVKKRKLAPTAGVNHEDQVNSVINQFSGFFC